MRYILINLFLFLHIILANAQVTLICPTAKDVLQGNSISLLNRDIKDFISTGTNYNATRLFKWHSEKNYYSDEAIRYKTWLYGMSALSFILFSIIVIIKYRTYQLKKQRLILFNRLIDHTSQLKRVNISLEERKKEIEDKNFRLNQYCNHLQQQVNKHAEDLKTALKKAEESERLKNAFLSNISHEIRTPMNALVGFSSMLGDLELSKEEREELVSYIGKSSEKLLALINDLMEMSQMQANQIVVDNQSDNLIEILNELHATFQLKAKSKGLELNIDTGAFRDTLVCSIDRIRLKQILSKLISNAIKFTECGSVQFGIKSKPGSYLTFYIKDSGIGIPEEVGNSIFKTFLKVQSPTTKFYDGIGLGLSFCHNLINKMGGNIWYESELEKGTTFYFTIPYNNTGNISISNIKNSDKPDTPNLQSKKIHIVKDKEINFRLLKENPKQKLG